MKILFSQLSFLLVMVSLPRIPIGLCTKCGAIRVGWALLNPRYQACPVCGESLEIMDGSGRVFRGHSPSSANVYLPGDSDQEPTQTETPTEKSKN